MEFFWRAAPDGVMEEVYFSPLRMSELEECLLDVVIEFYQGNSLNKWAHVSFREIENFLRDMNTIPAFPSEMAQKDLFYTWIGQLVYEGLIKLTHWSEETPKWDELPQIERIKSIQSILSGQLLKIELVDLTGNELTISLDLFSAPIQNSVALFARDLLRKELGCQDLEIILET